VSHAEFFSSSTSHLTEVPLLTSFLSKHRREYVCRDESCGHYICPGLPCSPEQDGKAFGGNTDLSRHMITHQDDDAIAKQMVPCHLGNCGGFMMRKDKLPRHQRRRHRLDMWL
jgi:hypothetical protein